VRCMSKHLQEIVEIPMGLLSRVENYPLVEMDECIIDIKAWH